jgi:hypothetical protein
MAASISRHSRVVDESCQMGAFGAENAAGASWASREELVSRLPRNFSASCDQ